VAIFSFPNIAGGNTTITGVISGAATQVIILAQEWNGLFVTSPFDKNAANNSGASSTTSGNSNTTLTLSQPVELAVTMLTVVNNAGAGFVVSSPFTADPKSPVQIAASNLMAVGYNNLNSTTGVQGNFTWTNASQWASVIATYKATAAPSAAGTMPFSSVQFFTTDKVLVP
jgi:hypothetical protein